MGYHLSLLRPKGELYAEAHGLEACASLFVAIDILSHNDGIRHFGFEGQTVETARGLLVLVACALQYLHKSGAATPSPDPSTIADLADNFSYIEVKKKNHAYQILLGSL